jgi:hypothetical protein
VETACHYGKVCYYRLKDHDESEFRNATEQHRSQILRWYGWRYWLPRFPRFGIRFLMYHLVSGACSVADGRANGWVAGRGH